jgi:hypothetical protein
MEGSPTSPEAISLQPSLLDNNSIESDVRISEANDPLANN